MKLSSAKYQKGSKQEQSAIRKSTVQAKLKVNTPGDQYEQDADAMAEKAMQKKKMGADTSVIARSVQRKALPRQSAEENDKNKPQWKAGANNGMEVSPTMEERLVEVKGGGAPLPAEPRRFMENVFGADFSKVRIHSNETAADLNNEIGAKAFTYGNDIFFNKGQYTPDSITGTGLLAHELTHVLQQTGDQEIRRKGDDSRPPQKTPPEDPKVYESGDYKLDKQQKTMDVPGLSMPFFKERNSKKIKTPILSISTQKFDPLKDQSKGSPQKKKYRRIETNQVKNWQERVRYKVTEKVTDTIGKSDHSKEGYYFLTTISKNSSLRVIGTLNEVAEAALIPDWGRNGDTVIHQVDHIEELQLGGADTTDNYELLDASANGSVGSLILGERKTRIKEALESLKKNDPFLKSLPLKDRDQYLPKQGTILSDFITTFKTIINWNLGKNNPKSRRGKDYYWDLGEVLEGKHLMQLRPMKQSEIDALEGSDKELSILLRRSSTVPPKKFPKKLDQSRDLVKGLTIHTVSYYPDAKTGENIALLEGELFQKQKKKGLVKMGDVRIPIVKMPGLFSFGVIAGKFSDFIISKPQMPVLCPIDILEADIDPAGNSVFLSGNILPEISFLEKIGIDVLYDGDDIMISKTFTSDDLKGKVPSLIELTSGEVTIFASIEQGLGVDGQLDFEIKKLGTGFIRGRAATKGDFSLGFGFSFNKGLFDKSEISGGYEVLEGKELPEFYFTGYAEKLPQNSKIFKRARIEVKYINGVLTAIGEAETHLPGLNKGTIQVVTGKEGTMVVADFTFTDKLPAIQSGNLHFVFVQKEDGSYAIEASADLNTKFKGIPTVSLHGYYNSDGVFLFEGDAILNIGRFNGNIHLGITNQQVDEKGQLTGKMGKELVPFGKGVVNFKMTDWLSGSIGATVTPDARTILSGELKPDPHLPITKLADPIRKKFGQFSLPRFTLFGIPHVAEIFVEVSGGLYFNADIGPLYLNNASLSFNELDIAAPEKTVITGKGNLDIPASAEIGVEATVKAGGGILVVIVYVDLTGSIGFAVIGNAGLDFSFEWSSGGGFHPKDSMAYLKARSELVGRLKGTLKVDLDLLLTTVNLYERPLFEKEKRWPLGLDLDANFPLAFNGTSEGGFKVPAPDEVKHSEPKVDEDAVKKAAVEEPPVPEPAPGKEEALQKVRTLFPDAELGANWITIKFERYNYIKNLKNKYPNLNWDYLDAEAKQLDANDFERLKVKLLDTTNLPVSGLGRTIRLGLLAEFEDKRLYVNYSAAADLRKQIEQMPSED